MSHDQNHPKLIAVTIDTHRREIPAGKYTGATLKQALGVPADYELNQVLNGEFVEITNDAHVTLEKSGEHFVAHVSIEELGRPDDFARAARFIEIGLSPSASHVGRRNRVGGAHETACAREHCGLRSRRVAVPRAAFGIHHAAVSLTAISAKGRQLDDSSVARPTVAHLVLARSARRHSPSSNADVPLGRVAMKTLVRLTDRLLTSIHADLDRPHDYAAERVGFLTCEVADLPKRGLCLYGVDYHPVADADYADDPRAGAMLNGNAFRKILQRIYHKPASVLHVHRHDHRGKPGPSVTDERESRRFVPNFWNVCPKHPHGTLILSYDDAWGALWIAPDQDIVELDACAIVGNRTSRRKRSIHERAL